MNPWPDAEDAGLSRRLPARLRLLLNNLLDSPRAPLYALALGITIVLVSTRIAWEAADRESRLQAAATAERIASRIAESLAEHETLLRVASQMAAPAGVSGLEGIRGFILGDMLAQSYRSVTYLAFVRKVPHAALAAYERSLRSHMVLDESGLSSAVLRTAGGPNHLFLESGVALTGKLPAVGTDLGEDTHFTTMVARAESVRGLTLLPEARGTTPALLQGPALLALVRNPLSRHPDTDSFGALVMGLDVRSMVEGVLSAEPAGTWDVLIAPESAKTGGAEYQSGLALYTGSAMLRGAQAAKSGAALKELVQRELSIGGVPLCISIFNHRRPSPGLIGSLPWLVFLASSTILALLWLLLRRTQAQRIRAEAMARMSGVQAEHSQQRFRNLVESSSDWIWEVDRNLRFTYVSPNTHLLLGIEPEKLIGRPLESLAPPGAEGRQHPMFPFPRPVPTAYNRHERQLVRGDGSQCLFESSASLIIDGDGRFAGLRGIDRDVTEQRRIAVQLSELRDKLAETMQANLMEQLLSGLAHELNQPLSAITSYAQACVRLLENDPGDLGSVRQALKSTASQAMLAADIVKGLRRLTTSRSPHIVRTELGPLLRNALSLADLRIQSAGVAVQMDLAPDLPFVWADPVLLTQVCLNLLHNAVDALAPVQERRIEVRARADAAGNVTIAFRDNGPGIAPADAARIFDKRFTTKSEGMGLGLTISRSILEALNGSLTYAPAPEGGSVFTITLPYRDSRPR